jgi:hypothetical protein
MNGHPYYSPPCRHTKDLGSKFIFGDLDEKESALQELPMLIERAIRAGLVERPEPVIKLVEPDKHIRNWQRAKCEQCGVDFIRNQRRHEKCVPCRVQRKNCTVCEKEFQPEHSKQKCCSRECVLKSSMYARMPKQNRPTHTCTVCGKQFEGRLSGVGWAKTCDVACANEARSRYHAERRALRLLAKAAKK